jgi:uncharacterized membrane protein
MTPGIAIADAIVPLFGVAMVVSPAITRPTLQFGVRVPPEQAGTPVIRQARRAYQWRTAVVAVVATAAAFGSWGHGSNWLPRVILILEIAAGVGCYQLGRRKVRAVKASGDWFAGRRQTVVADTSWRADPARFPVWWLVPALAVVVATVVARLVIGHPAAHVPLAGFAVVIEQVWLTGVWTGMLRLVYRSRPDLETADPAASLRRYRALLDTYAKAALVFVALFDVSMLLLGLQGWGVYHLTGGAVIVLLLPILAGLILFFAVAFRAGRRAWATGSRPSAATDRDDDQFWKGGLIYVNHDDPAVLVSARFGVGWTPNFGNRVTWLLAGGYVAILAGLIVLLTTVGL